MRLHQELVLGVGGVRALRALGIAPAAWHLNEGHSAFLLVERARELVAAGVPFEEALEQVRSRSVFTIHTPGLGRQRAVRRGPGADASRARSLDGAGAGHRAHPGDRSGRGRRPRPVRHDRLLAAPVASAPTPSASSTRRPPTRTWHEIVGQPILGITNGVHPGTLAGRAHPRSCIDGLGADLDQHGRRAARGPVLGAPAAASPTRSCGTPTWSRSWSSRYFARGRLRDQLARHGEAPSELRGRRAAARPVDPDHRLRAPVRDLQARRRCCSATRSAWRACCGTRSVPSRSCSRARRTRPTGPASGSSRTSSRAAARSASRAACSSSRTTTSAIGPLPGPGCRCLAQQPAATARGVRHERHEGGHERRRQLLRARRLVGRGLDRATTAGPSAGARPTPTRAPRTGRTRRPCTSCWSRRSCPAGTTATQRGLPAAGWRTMRESMATLHLAVLDHADARGVRRAASYLPGGARPDDAGQPRRARRRRRGARLTRPSRS